MIFIYQTNKTKGWLEAHDKKEARITLVSKHILPQTLQEAPKTYKLKSQNRATLYSSLGTLIKSGITIENAITLLSSSENDLTALPLLQIREKIRHGQPLSTATEETIPNLPSYEITALKTAEQTGLQGEMLLSLSTFIQNENSTKNRIKAALIYPLTVLILATLLLSLMVYIILPQAITTFPTATLPPFARFIINDGATLLNTIYILSSLTALTIYLLHHHAKHNPTLNSQLNTLLLKLPILGPLLSLLYAHRFADTMSLLLYAGVPPQSAITSSGAATGSPLITTLAQTASHSITQGTALSTAITTITPISSHLHQWFRVGEQTGSLTTILQECANRTRSIYETRLTHLLSLLEPLLILLVGLIVLLVTTSVLRPLLTLVKPT